MSSYHGQIINLPASVPDGLRDDNGSVLTDVAMAYKYGHRDARHAAAKLAAQADARIAELKKYGETVTGYRNNREKELQELYLALLPIWSALDNEKHAQAEKLWPILKQLEEY